MVFIFNMKAMVIHILNHFHYLKKIREHIIDVIEVLKRIRSSRKIWTIFEYDKNNKKAEKEMFTSSDYVTIT